MNKNRFIFLVSLLFASCFDGKPEAYTPQEKTSAIEPKKYVNYEVLADSVLYHYIYRSGISFYLKGETVSFKVEG